MRYRCPEFTPRPKARPGSPRANAEAALAATALALAAEPWWAPFFTVVDSHLIPKVYTSPPPPWYAKLFVEAGENFLFFITPFISLISLFSAHTPSGCFFVSTPTSQSSGSIEDWVAMSAVPSAVAANARTAKLKRAFEEVHGVTFEGKTAAKPLSPSPSVPLPSVPAPLLFHSGHLECVLALGWLVCRLECLRILTDDKYLCYLLLFSAVLTLIDRVRETIVLEAYPRQTPLWLLLVDLLLDEVLVGWVLRGLVSTWYEQDAAAQRFKRRQTTTAQ